MDQDLATKIQNRLEELPEEIRRAVQSAEVDRKIREVGTKNALHVDQIGNLSDETYMVMLCFTDPAEFAENLSKELNISAEKANTVAQDIGTSIFIPIRGSMQEFTEQQALQETLVAESKKTPAIERTSIPIVKPVSIVPASAPKAIEPHPADMMLAQKTVILAPTTPPTSPEASKGTAKPPATPPPAPKPYTADPYREPTN